MRPPEKQAAEPAEEYALRLRQGRASLDGALARHRGLGNVRLALLLAGLAGAFAAYCWDLFPAWWLLALAGLLVWLGFRMHGLEAEASKLERAAAFYQRGLDRLAGRWAGLGEAGDRFRDADHLYCEDLDLFGRASLFELLSAARTRMGEERLAGWLKAPSAPEEVRARQEAVAELSARLDLREDLAVIGEDARVGVHPEALAAWGARAPLLELPGFRPWAFALSALGALAAGVTVASTLGGASFPPGAVTGVWSYVALTLVAIAVVLRRFKKRTDQVIREVEEALRDLDLLAGVLKRLEAERFSSPGLVALRAALDVEGKPPSERLGRLHFLMDLLDSRENQIFGFFAPLLLWDIHLAYLFEDWRRSSGPALRRWLDAVGEMEAICSLAGYCYENPDYAFPELAADGHRLEAEGLAHPLLPREGAVANDLDLGGELRALVVSGSNMSGKSTLLRTVGVNVVLAQAGAPVRAKRMRLSPLAVCASIRTQDSLQGGVSRFYAEILRLGAIMRKTAGPLPALFLIDEVLHGTNSHDRRIGAEAIVRGLVGREAIGLITTHDLALARIAETLGARGGNVHFQDQFENGEMRFDFKMRPGVVERSNALELMRSVGLDV